MMRIPWQVFLFITILVYTVVNITSWLSPCEDSLFIGMCGLGKIIVTGLTIPILATYTVIVLILQRTNRKTAGLSQTMDKQYRWIVSFSLLFSLMPILVVIYLRSFH